MVKGGARSGTLGLAVDMVVSGVLLLGELLG